MASCEKCWKDAASIMLDTGESHYECYVRLLYERENNPCTPREQAGQFWDETRNVDRREPQYFD